MSPSQNSNPTTIPNLSDDAAQCISVPFIRSQAAEATASTPERLNAGGHAQSSIQCGEQTATSTLAVAPNESAQTNRAVLHNMEKIREEPRAPAAPLLSSAPREYGRYVHSLPSSTMRGTISMPIDVSSLSNGCADNDLTNTMTPTTMLESASANRTKVDIDPECSPRIHREREDSYKRINPKTTEVNRATTRRPIPNFREHSNESDGWPTTANPCKASQQVVAGNQTKGPTLAIPYGAAPPQAEVRLPESRGSNAVLQKTAPNGHFPNIIPPRAVKPKPMANSSKVHSSIAHPQNPHSEDAFCPPRRTGPLQTLTPNIPQEAHLKRIAQRTPQAQNCDRLSIWPIENKRSHLTPMQNHDIAKSARRQGNLTQLLVGVPSQSDHGQKEFGNTAEMEALKRRHIRSSVKSSANVSRLPLVSTTGTSKIGSDANESQPPTQLGSIGTIARSTKPAPSQVLEYRDASSVCGTTRHLLHDNPFNIPVALIHHTLTDEDFNWKPSRNAEVLMRQFYKFCSSLMLKVLGMRLENRKNNSAKEKGEQDKLDRKQGKELQGALITYFQDWKAGKVPAKWVIHHIITNLSSIYPELEDINIWLKFANWRSSEYEKTKLSSGVQKPERESILHPRDMGDRFPVADNSKRTGIRKRTRDIISSSTTQSAQRGKQNAANSKQARTKNKIAPTIGKAIQFSIEDKLQPPLSAVHKLSLLGKSQQTPAPDAIIIMRKFARFSILSTQSLLQNEPIPSPDANSRNQRSTEVLAKLQNCIQIFWKYWLAGLLNAQQFIDGVSAFIDDHLNIGDSFDLWAKFGASQLANQIHRESAHNSKRSQGSSSGLATHIPNIAETKTPKIERPSTELQPRLKNFLNSTLKEFESYISGPDFPYEKEQQNSKRLHCKDFINELYRKHLEGKKTTRQIVSDAIEFYNLNYPSMDTTNILPNFRRDYGMPTTALSMEFEPKRSEIENCSRDKSHMQFSQACTAHKLSNRKQVGRDCKDYADVPNEQMPPTFLGNRTAAPEKPVASEIDHPFSDLLQEKKLMSKMEDIIRKKSWIASEVSPEVLKTMSLAAAERLKWIIKSLKNLGDIRRAKDRDYVEGKMSNAMRAKIEEREFGEQRRLEVASKFRLKKKREARKERGIRTEPSNATNRATIQKKKGRLTKRQEKKALSTMAAEKAQRDALESLLKKRRHLRNQPVSQPALPSLWNLKRSFEERSVPGIAILPPTLTCAATNAVADGEPIYKSEKILLSDCIFLFGNDIRTNHSVTYFRFLVGHRMLNIEVK